jgi:hypothetical protein
MASVFFPTGAYSNLTRLQLEQLRRADFFAGGKALTVGDSALPPEGVVGIGTASAEPYLTGPNVLLDDVYSITPPVSPGTSLGTLTQTSGFPSETVRWYGPTYVFDAVGSAFNTTHWQDTLTPGLNFALFVQAGDILLIKDVTDTGGGPVLNFYAVATVSAVFSATRLTLTHTNAPNNIGFTTQLAADGHTYAYVIVRPNATQLFAVPGSGPTGQEQTFLAVVPGSALHTNFAPTLNQIEADRVKSIVPPQYTHDTAIDRADGVYDAPAPRFSLDKLGYRIVLYPRLPGGGPDLSNPISTLNPVIDPAIPAADQRFTVDYKSGTIRFSCAPATTSVFKQMAGGGLNGVTGRLDLFAVFWAVDQSLTAGTARGLWAARSTTITSLVSGRVYFDPTTSVWRMGSTTSGNNAYVKALGTTEDPDLTTEVGALDTTLGVTFGRRYFAWRPFNATSKPGGINPSGRWRMLNQESSFNGFGTDATFTTEQEVADRTEITVGDIAAPPPAQADVGPTVSFQGVPSTGARASDQALLTALLQAVAGGHSKVRLKKGRYYTTQTIYIPPGVTVEGVGPGTVFESRTSVGSSANPLSTPVFKIGPNSRFGTYDFSYSGTYSAGTFNPKVFTQPLANTRLEGVDVVWNPVRRVWGMVWADLTTNTVFFNEIATDGTTLTFPGFGVDIKNTVTPLFSTLSVNSGNHTPGHYPRIVYHEFTDTYACVWLEEYNPGTGVGPRVAVQAFNVLPFPRDAAGKILPASLTPIFFPTPAYVDDLHGAPFASKYCTHPSVAVDTSTTVPGFNIFVTCWGYDSTLATSLIIRVAQPAAAVAGVPVASTGFNYSLAAQTVLSSTDTADDGAGGYLFAWSRREHPLILSSTGQIHLSALSGGHSDVVDPTYPNWGNVGVKIGTKYVPLGPASMTSTSSSNWIPVNYQTDGVGSGGTTFSNAGVNFVTAGVKVGDILWSISDAIFTRITVVAAHALTVVATMPTLASRHYFVFSYPGYMSLQPLVLQGATQTGPLYPPMVQESPGDGVVYAVSPATNAQVRPTEYGIVYNPVTSYVKWYGNAGSAPGGGVVLTDATLNLATKGVDFTTMGLVVGDILLDDNMTAVGYIDSWTANTVTLHAATLLPGGAIPAGAGLTYWILAGNCSYAMVPQSYIEAIHHSPLWGDSSTRSIAGNSPQSTHYVVSEQEPDFVRISRSDADWLVTYQTFNTTGYFAKDSNVNWDGGEIHSTWTDYPANKHLRYLDRTAVYRVHIGTNAVILSDAGKIGQAEAEGLQLTPNATSFLERASRAFEVSNRSLGVRNPITLRTGYYDNGATTNQQIRAPHPFSMQVSPLNFSYRWTTAKSPSLIPGVTWSGSDWTVVSPSKKTLHSYTGNYIVDGAGNVSFGDLTFMFGESATNSTDGLYLRRTVTVGDRIYFPSAAVYGSIGAIHNEHIVVLNEADVALLNLGNSTRTAQIEWVLVRDQVPLAAGIKNPGYRISSDGKVIVSSSFNTFADEPLDNSELGGASEIIYPRTQLMRRVYDDAFRNYNKYDGPNLPGGLAFDMLESESRHVADIGFKGIVVGEPKGCNEQVLDEPPCAAIAWGDNFYGFADHVIAGFSGTALNDVRFYRQSFGPYNAGLKDMRIIGRVQPNYTDADTSFELKVMSRRLIGTRNGPPTGAMGFFATDGYRNVYGKAVASASYSPASGPQVIGFEWMQPSFVYTNALGGDPFEVYGPAAIIPNGGLQNDVSLTESDGVTPGSNINANSLVSAPKIIWDGKQFVAVWSEGGKQNQEQLICVALLPGGEDTRTLTFDATDPNDTLKTKVAGVRAIDNRTNNAVATTSVIALDVAYSGSSYAVLWIAGLNYSGWFNSGTKGLLATMVGVTIFDETGFSGGHGVGAALDSPPVVMDLMVDVNVPGWLAMSYAAPAGINAQPLPQVGDTAIFLGGGLADGSGLGRYTVTNVNGSISPPRVQFSPAPPVNAFPVPGTSYTTVFYRPSKGNGGITHILDVNASIGEAMSHPHILWNGHSFVAMWDQAPQNVSGIQTFALVYTQIPPHGFSDPVHIKWIGSGNETHDFVEPTSWIADTHLGILTNGTASPVFYWAQSDQQEMSGFPPYPVKGDTLVVTKTTRHAFYVGSVLATGTTNGTTTMTDTGIVDFTTIKAGGPVGVGDIFQITSDVDTPTNIGYYRVVGVGGAHALTLDRTVPNSGASKLMWALSDSTVLTVHDDDGWYVIDGVKYNSATPSLVVANKTWASTSGFVNIRVYGSLLTGGANDSRSLPTNVPRGAGSNMVPKIITYAQTGLAGSTYPQGQYLRNIARLYGMAYNPADDEYCILFSDGINLIVTAIHASTMEPIREKLIWSNSTFTIRTASIAWNGRHFLVVYSVDDAVLSSIPYYASLSSNLSIQENTSIISPITAAATVATLAGQGLGAVPGPTLGAANNTATVKPRVRNMQVRWNNRLNRWIVSTSVLWAREWGTNATDDVMPGGWQLAGTHVTAVSGNVLTLSGPVAADVALLQPGMKLVIMNVAKTAIAHVFGILAVNIGVPTITLDTSFPADLDLVAVETLIGTDGRLWVYPREDTWAFTIGYDQPSVQIEDADGTFIDGVTFDGMIDVEEKYLRMASPIRQSGGVLVGWPAWTVTGTPAYVSHFMRQPYNHGLLTPSMKVSMTTYTNVRSNTKVKYGYGYSLVKAPDRYTMLGESRRRG